MSLPRRLLLATTNPGKLGEWRALLGPLGVEVVAMEGPQAEEGSTSVVENARLKATHAAHGTAVLADDVGLAIDALHGEPGPELKRWALGRFGSWGAAQEHCAALAGSGATYACGLALVLPDGTVHTALGEVRGSLVAARGSGPGLEPCFLPDGSLDVLSQLSDDARGRLHHRHRALSALLNQLAPGSPAP